MKFQLPGIRWTWLRRAAQLAVLALFLWLFRRTEGHSGTQLSEPVNFLFRLDPLVALSAVVAGRELILLLWPALLVVTLTLVLGRFFCGWVCPLGTLLDVAGRFLPRRERSLGGRWRVVKFFLLGVVVTTALVGMPLIGWVNPFAILVRGLTLAVDPMLTWAGTAPFAWLLRNAPEWVTQVSEPVHAWLKQYVLAFSQARFLWAGVSLGLLAGVFLLELAERR
ncbi:MAG: 4Fe-4S binding protein, partial [Verrucomicrobiae bacterium]|nr:4Fe-4S binding protein [Verrucomicrobiae bacterium]